MSTNESDFRPMPHDLNAEGSVIGAILLDNRALDELALFLKPIHFYRGANRLMYEAMLALGERGQAIDFITLRDELRKRGTLDKVGGLEAIVEAGAAIPSTANVDQYAKIVREKWLLRALADIGSEISVDARAPHVDAPTLLDTTEQKVLAIASDSSAVDTEHKMGEVMVSSFGIIDGYHRERGKINGIPSGFIDLDAVTSGFRKGELVVVAARPSMGKTTFALNIAMHAAIEEKKGVAIYSLETDHRQVGLNMLCSIAGIDAHKMRQGEIPEFQWSSFPEYGNRLATSNMTIDDCAVLSPMTLRGKARRVKAKYGLDMVIIDYVQLMRPPHDVENNRQQQVAAISRSLKELARELDVTVIALSQLNRATDGRAERRPSMSDIRESGAIEQDADVICLLYRDDYYNAKSQEKGIAEVIVAKHRNGPTGTVRLGFQPEHLRFVNLAYEHGPA